MIKQAIRPTITGNFKLSILGSIIASAFTPEELFKNGEQGVWYDPSDLATMFQESTGTTAVTADGQPVGLMLDKSQSLELGDELITNGTFDTDSDWLLYTGWEITGGKLKSVSDSDNYAVDMGNVFESNKMYEITYTISDYVSGDLRVLVGASRFLARHNADGVYTQRHITSGYTLANSWLYFFGPSFEGSIDNVSVKEVLGIHASQPVATQRPTYKDTPDRLTLDLVDDSLAFTVPIGGIDGYMVVGTDDGTASYGVSLPAGDYDIGGDYFMGGSVNGFLLREGSVSQADLAKVEKDFLSKGAKASYGDVTDFTNYWRDKNITEFPMIDTSSGTSFYFAWYNNNLTSFPLLDTSSGTNFGYAWYRCSSLTSFPANMFDSCLATNFANAFSNTNLSEQSIDNILVSINSSGTSNGTFNQSGGSAPSVAGEVAIMVLRARGWTVTVTGGF